MVQQVVFGGHISLQFFVVIVINTNVSEARQTDNR